VIRSARVFPICWTWGLGCEGQWAKKFVCKSVDGNWDGLNVLEGLASGKCEFSNLLIHSVCPNTCVFKLLLASCRQRYVAVIIPPQERPGSF